MRMNIVAADFDAVERVRAEINRAGLVAEMAEVTWRAENSVSLSSDEAAKMQKLLDILEDLDDVQNVFHNAEFED
jgi:transcriptional/translational regulatory protein YebC/TACO1